MHLAGLEHGAMSNGKTLARKFASASQSQNLSFASRRPAINKSTSHSFFLFRKRFSMRVSEAPHELRVRLSLAVFHRKSLMNLAGTDFSTNLSYALHALLGNLP